MHELKTDPAVFAAVLAGAKTHEIRFDDRGFAVGDTLLLRETTHTGAEIKAGAPLEYTGRTTTRTVSHIQTGYGLADGWCILSFAGGAAQSPAAPNEPVQALPELPELPRPACTYADHSYPAFSKAQMQDYARAAIASCCALPAKDDAHGHREDWYLMANARRITEQPIRLVRTMTNREFASELFATGSNSAHKICLDAGINPDGFTVERAALAASNKGEWK
ncbi:DUF3850 domain-containing protein [Massilia sp. UMI-21]|nr:DUF3850 domain-containing protein [Massilia sp. UMI-21]